MPRFFLPPEKCQGATLSLSGREAHHAVRVLRLSEGDNVTVLDGKGSVIQCTVTQAGKRSLTLAVTKRLTPEARPPRLTLIQAIPKGKAFDFILQKATELGAARIIPVLSGRVVPDLKESEAQSKVEKWRQIAIEAIKQCGSPWLPDIEPPATLRSVIARGSPSEFSLVAALVGNRQHPRVWFQEFAATHQRMPASVAVWVGPEGDFTSDEVEAIISTGARPITLGPNVLRADTAAIYCLSVLNYELNYTP